MSAQSPGYNVSRLQGWSQSSLWGQFHDVLLATKTSNFSLEVGSCSGVFVLTVFVLYFKPNHDVSLGLTKCFLCLNLSRTSEQIMTREKKKKMNQKNQPDFFFFFTFNSVIVVGLVTNI